MSGRYRANTTTPSRAFLIVAMTIGLGLTAYAAEFPCHYPAKTEPPGRHFPYVDTDYQEDYRRLLNYDGAD